MGVRTRRLVRHFRHFSFLDLVELFSAILVSVWVHFAYPDWTLPMHAMVFSLHMLVPVVSRIPYYASSGLVFISFGLDTTIILVQYFVIDKWQLGGNTVSLNGAESGVGADADADAPSAHASPSWAQPHFKYLALGWLWLLSLIRCRQPTNVARVPKSPTPPVQHAPVMTRPVWHQAMPFRVATTADGTRMIAVAPGAEHCRQTPGCVLMHEEDTRDGRVVRAVPY